MAALTVTMERVGDRNALAQAWNALEQDADASFFLSWGWLECWLNHLPSSLQPLLLRIRDDGRTIGLGLLIERAQRRRGFVYSRRLLLHESGDPGLDRIFIEHNGFLATRGFESQVTSAALAFLEKQGRWDEIVLGGICPASLELRTAGVLQPVARPIDAPFVNLDSVRRSGGSYLESLGKNTRYAIRRSLKLYGARGCVRLRQATTTQEALSFFECMARLHQRYWTGRGESGVFAEPSFRRFHASLIASRFAADEVQLLHATAGDSTIGYLYNFRKNGRVYQYQSGLSYEASPHLKPGLVSHCLAVQAAIDCGDEVYDFLTGEDRYKRNLANDAQRLVWLTLRRDLWRFLLEDLLRHAWQRWRHR